MEFTRGDTYKFKFQRKDASGNVITSTPEAIYFTVKYDKNTKVPAFQKKYLSSGGSDGITFDDTDYTYHVTITPADTETLDFGDYIYDIEVTVSGSSGYVQTISKGALTLLSESTWKANKA